MNRASPHKLSSHVVFIDEDILSSDAILSPEVENTETSPASPLLEHEPGQSQNTEHPQHRRRARSTHGTCGALLRRSHTNSQPDGRSRSTEGRINSTDLHIRLIRQTSHPGTPPVKSSRIQRIRTTTGPFGWMDPDEPSSPGFMWFPRQVTSEPVTPKQPKTKSELEAAFPLKTCLKRRSESTTASTPVDPDMEFPGQTLRRVKTVEFVGPSEERPTSLPPLQPWTGESKASGASPVLRRTPSCPGPRLKSGAADAAMTRTDVHVVAIVPCWCPQDSPVAELNGDNGIHPYTPTMQIVESDNGLYEVVWDDKEPEDMVFTQRTPTHYTPASSPFISSLQRVNTKLSEWFWNKDTPSDSTSTPLLQVPEEMLPTRRFECAIEDENEPTTVPPNSTVTSTEDSQGTSRRSSIPLANALYRSVSESGAESSTPSDTESLHSEPANVTIPAVEPLLTLPPHVVSHRRIRHPPMVRRLSNLEEYGTQRKFRWHRDSVTLARERITNVGGASPELYLHRDSVEIAKKRMKERKTTGLGAKERLKKVGE